MRAGLRPWELERCSPGALVGWCHAHYGKDPEDGRSQVEQVDDLMRRVYGERR